MSNKTSASEEQALESIREFRQHMVVKGLMTGATPELLAFDEVLRLVRAAERAAWEQGDKNLRLFFNTQIETWAANFTKQGAVWEQEKVELLARVDNADFHAREERHVSMELQRKKAAWEQREKQYEKLRLAAEELLLSDLAYDEAAHLKLSEALAALKPSTGETP